MIRGHPPLIEFSSFLIKLEYHVNLSFASMRDRRAPIPKTTPLPRLALFALVHRLIASHQHSNRIAGVLRVDVGVDEGVDAGAGAGARAGVLAER